MSNPAPVRTDGTIRGLRRAAIIGAIASLSIAAIVGIVMLLTGDWGDTQSRIMGTTLIIGAFSILALADLAIAGRRTRWVGWIGAAIAAGTGMLGILMVWGALDDWRDAFTWFLTGIVLSIALAQSCMLLLLEQHRHRLLRIGLPLTLVFIAISTVLVLLPILSDGDIPGAAADEWYWRLFGVALILAVLGSVVLPVAGLVMRERPAAATAGLSVPVPPELAAQVIARAAEVGVAPQDFVLQAVRERLGAD